MPHPDESCRPKRPEKREEYISPPIKQKKSDFEKAEPNFPVRAQRLSEAQKRDNDS